MNGLIELLDENVGELVIAIAIATFYILLGIDDNILGQKYLKKFSILCYFLLGIVVRVFQFNLMITLLIFSFIFFLSSLNMLEYFSIVEKNLKKKDLIVFSFVKWFFHTKLYIFILFSAVGTFASYLFGSKSYIVIVLFIGVIYHQISFAKDTFGYHDFDYLLNELNSITYFLHKDDESLKNEISVLAFILFMEDKDFFNRDKVGSGVKMIYKRNKHRYFERLSKLKWRLLYPEVLNRLINKYWRGYSTIEMQVVRTTVLKNDSYQYTFRRKLLIEYFYTEYFIKAIMDRFIRYNISSFNRDRHTTQQQILSTIKILFLQYYYIKTINMPKSIDEFIRNSRSRVTIAKYQELYKIYKESELDGYFESQIENNLRDYRMINY